LPPTLASSHRVYVAADLSAQSLNVGPVVTWLDTPEDLATALVAEQIRSPPLTANAAQARLAAQFAGLGPGQFGVRPQALKKRGPRLRLATVRPNDFECGTGGTRMFHCRDEHLSHVRTGGYRIERGSASWVILTARCRLALFNNMPVRMMV
jgi:hypothetical protein